MKEVFKSRIRFILFFFILMAAAIFFRLFFLQVVRGEAFRQKAEKQYLSGSATDFDRGDIFFSKKDGTLFSAASVKGGYTFAIKPNIISSPENIFKEISKIIPLDRSAFFAAAEKANDPYEILAKRLEKETADKILSLNLKSIDISPDFWRSYPSGNLASHVLGFAGFNKDEIVGRYGVEKYYEDILKRNVSDTSIGINSFVEIFMDLKNAAKGNLFTKGDVVLTIEPVVQSFLEKEIDKAVEKYSPELAGGIIMEPKTGKILAMTGKPDFDPNQYSKVEDISYYMNPSVESVFEMGSIMKPLTMAAALDQGAVTSETKYEDKGFIVLDQAKIENFDGKARGFVDMQEVLSQSLNTGAVFAMQKLGKEKFRSYIINYGLGEKTGIDLPSEVKGMISNLESKREIEYANASFGQGIAVTPIEMAVALSSLANGGAIMKPFVVEKIQYEGGKEKETKPREIRRVLKKETAEEITRMLVAVVDEALAGGTVKNDRYSVAAKTGTAQLAKDGGYSNEEYLHSFFGYAPAYDAKFLILLYLKNPKGVKYASHSLTEHFINLNKFLLNYYEVPPDR